MGSKNKKGELTAVSTATRTFVLGTPLIPREIVEEGLLTEEDYGAITLDHIGRTSEFVWQLQIVKTA